MKRWEKSGVAHFEMIVSFAFFMTFVLFLFAVLTPYSESPISETVLDRLYFEFVESSSTNLTSFFLKPNETETCFSVDLGSYDNSFTFGFSNSFVSDLEGRKVSSEISPNGLLKIQSIGPEYEVLISPEFEEASLGGASCNSKAYSIGPIKNEVALSNSTFFELSKEYRLNYEELKDRLNVPKIYDFTITSEDFKENNMVRLVPDSVDVYAKDYIVKVISSDGSVKNSKFTISVW